MATHTALYEFDGTETKDGLSFGADTLLEVTQKEGSGWWKGRSLVSNAVGWFPASYAKEIAVPPPTSAPPPQPLQPPQPKPQQTEDEGIESQYEAIGPLTGPPQPVYVAPPPPKKPPTAAPPPPANVQKPALTPPVMPPPTAKPPLVMPPPTTKPPLVMSPPSVQKPSMMPPGPPPKKPAAPPPKPNAAPPPPPPAAQVERKVETFFEQVGPAQNIPEMGDGGNGFCDNFWNDKGGKTGFDVLVLKHRNGKEIFKELSEFMKGRAAIEDAYGKALVKYSKQAETFKDIGLLHDSWLKVKAELASTGEAHCRFGNSLSNDFPKRIMDFKDTQKGTRKQYEATIASTRKSLVATVPVVEKLHETYSGLCIECMKYKELFEKGQQDNQTKKDYNRICEMLDKTTTARDQAGLSFKKSLEKYNTVQLEWIDEMLLACKEFEDAEVDRINFLKNVMTDYANASKDTVGIAIQKSEGIATAYDKVTPLDEVATWTNEEGTGRDRPKPYPYMTPAVIESAHRKQQTQANRKSKNLT